MAALSAARLTKSRNLGAKRKYLLKDSTACYAGGIAMIDSNGYALPAAASASNLGCVGVFTESKDSGTAQWVEVVEGEFLMGATSVAQTIVNAVLYATYDNEVDETQASNCPRAGIGTEYVSSTSCWVRIGVGV